MLLCRGRSVYRKLLCKEPYQAYTEPPECPPHCRRLFLFDAESSVTNERNNNRYGQVVDNLTFEGLTKDWKNRSADVEAAQSPKQHHAQHRQVSGLTALSLGDSRQVGQSFSRLCRP